MDICAGPKRSYNVLSDVIHQLHLKFASIELCTEVLELYYPWMELCWTILSRFAFEVLVIGARPIKFCSFRREVSAYLRPFQYGRFDTVVQRMDLLQV